MRLFVAAEIDPALARELARVADQVRQRVDSREPQARLTWVPADRLHFTIRFLGDVDAPRASAVASVLTPPLALAPFAVTLAGLGAFPQQGPPRVIWAGIGEGREAMRALEHEVSARLAACGIPPESRKYSPHLTLARVRAAAGLRSREVLDGTPQQPFGTTRVDAITLFESRLSPKGPAYVSLQRTPLRAG
jgi:2'-5' RNA ligase